MEETLKEIEDQIEQLLQKRDKIKKEINTEKIKKRIELDKKNKQKLIEKYGPPKILEIPVYVTGNDHESGWCSGHDGYELEGEISKIIVSTYYLVDYHNFTHDDFTENMFDDDGFWKEDPSCFEWRHKQCSAGGSGYCNCYINYNGCGKVKWLKDYKFDTEGDEYYYIEFPRDLKHQYKKYDDDIDD